MAAPTDRVQILKNESASTGGTEEDFLAAQLDPLEDAPSVHGVFVQKSAGPEDEAVYITRNAADDMVFRDPNANSGSELTLSDFVDRAWRRHFLLMGG